MSLQPHCVYLLYKGSFTQMTKSEFSPPPPNAVVLNLGAETPQRIIISILRDGEMITGVRNKKKLN